ncbi:uncharacterized protein LOC124367595 isoform X2 [Homalodisca vitripennis]|uniref:uncharacterized protein LOC124367595 isoform X2 n=2 Tax=Homalodisca vitripennis TaxID=197043 RepID=UPI001EEAEE09|nr:uncharacterized protein LOC124367595 isoform X2 [Homalodisca vitripennis]
MYVIPKEVLFIGQIFGYFPLKVKDGFRGPTRLVFSSKIFVCGVVLNLLLTIFTYLSLAVDFWSMMRGRPAHISSKTGALAITLDFVTLHLLAVSVFFNSSSKHQIFIDMCCILDRTDKMIPYRCDKSKIKMKVILVFSFLIAFLSYNLCHDFLSFQKKNQDNIPYMIYIPRYILHLAPALLLIQFTFVAEGLTERFRIVNIKIKLEINKHIFGAFRRRQGYSKDVYSTDAASTVASIKSMSECYWLLCDAVKKANMFYNNQLFFAVFSAFVHVIITLYYFFVVIIVISPTLSSLALLATWISTHITHLVLLVNSASDVTNAADRTGPTICRLVNKDLDPEIRKQ